MHPTEMKFRNIIMLFAWFFTGLFTGLITLLFAFGSINNAMAVERIVGPSGESVPRYASLKADKVNVRRGPGRAHKILWVFKQVGMPVKIVSEYENWREIEDQAGSRGWIFHSLLSRRRTGVTLDPEKKGVSYFSLFESSSKSSAQIAKLGKGVIVHVVSCTGQWCNVSVNKKLRGWINQELIWGLFDNEPIK